MQQRKRGERKEKKKKREDAESVQGGKRQKIKRKKEEEEDEERRITKCKRGKKEKSCRIEKERKKEYVFLSLQWVPRFSNYLQQCH